MALLSRIQNFDNFKSNGKKEEVSQVWREFQNRCSIAA